MDSHTIHIIPNMRENAQLFLTLGILSVNN